MAPNPISSANGLLQAPFTRQLPEVVPGYAPEYDIGMHKGSPPTGPRTRPAPRSSNIGRLLTGLPILALAIPLAVLAVGCAKPRLFRADIQSQKPGDRILAIRAAAQALDREAVPLLVDRLEDEDEAVRFYAILALDRITGRRLGYDYAQPSWKRSQAVEQWRKFVRNGRHMAGAAEPLKSQTETFEGDTTEEDATQWVRKKRSN